MISRRIPANGIEINVTDWGGKGRGIFFAHPTGFYGAVWRPIIERLRSRGFDARILTFDQRGHGLSSKPDRGYEWPNFISDVCVVVKALDVRDFLGVGHSAGGTTLIGVSVDRPESFRRLLLFDPILIDAEREAYVSGVENPIAARTRTRRLVWSSRQEMFDAFRNRRPYDVWTDEALRNYVEDGTFDRPDGEVELWCPGRIEAQVYQNGTTLDPYALLAALTVPVVFARGAESDSFGETRSAKAMEVTPEARMVTFDGVGHYIPMEIPERTVDLILAEFDA
jgi:pimeloyl-ACP methyl ester carboxylesterase